MKSHRNQWASLIVVFLTGFLTVGNSMSVDLYHTEWRLVELNGEKVSPLPGDRQPSLRIDPESGKVGGFSGCNRFFSTLKIEGDSLNWSPVGATRMACPGERDEVEARFLDMLGKASNWALVEGDLVFLNQGRPVARFAADRADPNHPD